MVAERSRAGRLAQIRRGDLLLGLLVALVGMGAVIGGSALAMALTFEPQGSLLGLPTRIPTCGRDYRTDPTSAAVWTRAQIEMQITPGSTPVILEPTLGQIPLSAPFAGGQTSGGVETCPTLVYLHIGPDAYRSYAAFGGP